MPGRGLFVWFRVERAHERDAVDAACALQSTLRQTLPGLTCELLRREDDGTPFCTLMEVYRCEADGVSPAWQALIEREAAARLGPWLQGARHVEVFAECGASAANITPPSTR